MSEATVFSLISMVSWTQQGLPAHKPRTTANIYVRAAAEYTANIQFVDNNIRNSGLSYSFIIIHEVSP